jgi:SNF2 family DNA or RNA helicase
VCRFFVGHVQAGGKGLTLHAASTVVYFSNDFSLENRLQSEDRAHRIGQTNHVTYIDMIAEDTLDAKIVSVLRDKKNVADLITGDEPIDGWL